jgi:hypothetical protein
MKGFANDPPAFTKITGGTWPVEDHNVWGDDYIGVSRAIIQYYQDHGRTPCAMTIPQRMVITCGQTNRAYVRNTLKISLTDTDVTDTRAGVDATKKVK